MTTARATLADVAREAGVGIATVSRALNGRPDVSAETIARVREVAATLGYRPSRTARALRRGSFSALSVIVPNSDWGWWEPVLRSAATAAADAGFHLFVHPAPALPGGLDTLIEGLADVPTEGVIVISVPDQQAIRAACDRIGLPVVAIDDSTHALHLATVAAGNRDGARRITEHLIERGHRRIAFVGAMVDGLESSWGEGLFIEERLSGYRDAMTEAGIPIDEDLVIGWPALGIESTVFVDPLDDLLAKGDVPDAIFCVADLAAPPVLRTLSAHGLSVPADVAVAGFDDERAALLMNPQLTTMRQPYDDIGRIAVNLLRRALGGEHLPVHRHTVSATLVERESTARGH
jgi:LacI family transcriptional regulator